MPMIEGMVLFPGAGGSKEHATLAALEDSLSPLPVIRREFLYRRDGKRVPPRAPKLVAELIEEQQAIAYLCQYLRRMCTFLIRFSAFISCAVVANLMIFCTDLANKYMPCLL